MISIFALPDYIGRSYSRHSPDLSARRLSSRLRGTEIAGYLGVKLNPPKREGVCIHVKPKDLKEVQDGDYVDFLDGFYLIHPLRTRPLVKIIAASQCSYEWLKKEFKNEVVLIPQHHINWDRLVRTKKEITTCGYIGNPSPEAFRLFEEIGDKLERIGLKLETCFNFKVRQDAIDLYMKTDIFVMGDWTAPDSPHRIPTKIINAASFGIPSVAYPMMGNKEIEGFYAHAKNLDEMIEQVSKFKDENYYQVWSDKVLKMAENYHISKMPDLYNKL